MISYLDTVRFISKYLDKAQNINKSLLFASLSGVAAFFGSIFGLNLNPLRQGIFFTGVWTTVIAVGIGASVSIIQNWYLQRLEVAQKDITKAILLSGLGGFIGGCGLIILKNTFGQIEGPLFGTLFFSHILGWTFEGAVIGFFVSKAIPNLPVKTAFYAGSGAGFLGGLLTNFHVNVYVGDAFKGVLIGLAIAAAEQLVKEAWIVVHRNPTDSNAPATGLVMMDKPATILLGEKPILIGSSSDCQVYVQTKQDQPPILATIILIEQRVAYDDKVSGQQSTLKAGSKIQQGDVTLEVCTKKTDAS